MIKKMTSLSATFLLTFVNLFSQSGSEQECCQIAPCAPNDCYGRCAQLWPSCGPSAMITPSAGPCVANGADLFITAEFIYWTVRQDHLGFCVPSEHNGTPNGHVVHPKWRMEPGFKVGLGMFFDCDGWDFYSNYTWLRTRDTKHTAGPTDSFLSDLGWISIIEPITQATGDWHHDFNVIDVELGRNFFISKCLHLRPYVGLKGTWQKQTMHLVYTTSSGDAIGENKIDYWGIGIRSGLDDSWHFCREFSLFGDFAASILWQQFDVENRATLRGSSFSFLKDLFHSIKPVVELIIGLRWEDWLCCDEYHYSLEAGWELQWWGDQNQFALPNLSNETRLGDLGLQGLTLKARFDF